MEVETEDVEDEIEEVVNWDNVEDEIEEIDVEDISFEVDMEDVVKGGVEDAGFKVEARDVGEEVDIGAALFGTLGNSFPDVHTGFKTLFIAQKNTPSKPFYLGLSASDYADADIRSSGRLCFLYPTLSI